MRLILTSDFPSTGNDAVAQCLQGVATQPRVAWIPPFTSEGRARFPAARTLFQSLGVSELDYCDIDEVPDKSRLATLDQYDAIYLTGGDPIGFRRNIKTCGLSESLGKFLSAGGLVVAASGGAMQCTRNVSLFRLLTGTVEEVLAERDECAGLGFVDYEILPHLNRFDTAFLEKVEDYSARVPHDVFGLEDGAALIHEEGGSYRCTGRVEKFRDGVRTVIV